MRRVEERTMSEETLIRQRVVDYAKAIGAKDLDGVASFFEPNLVSFDVAPPLRYAGADNKNRTWRELFSAYRSITYDVRDLTVATSEGLAYAHSLNHVHGTLANGHVTDIWVRWTVCFQRIRGAWLVVHDHVSVPVDLEHGRAVLDLTP